MRTIIVNVPNDHVKFVTEAVHKAGGSVADSHPTPEDLWGEDRAWNRHEWQRAVSEGETVLGYWLWVEHQRMN